MGPIFLCAKGFGLDWNWFGCQTAGPKFGCPFAHSSLCIWLLCCVHDFWCLNLLSEYVLPPKPTRNQFWLKFTICLHLVCITWREVIQKRLQNCNCLSNNLNCLHAQVDFTLKSKRNHWGTTQAKNKQTNLIYLPWLCKPGRFQVSNTWEFEKCLFQITNMLKCWQYSIWIKRGYKPIRKDVYFPTGIIQAA